MTLHAYYSPCEAVRQQVVELIRLFIDQAGNLDVQKQVEDFIIKVLLEQFVRIINEQPRDSQSGILM